MPNRWEPTIEELRKIQDLLDQGETTISALIREKRISYTRLKRICKDKGVELRGRRGKKATTYTMEKYAIVKARIENGEFVKNVTRELGMDYRNFCRFCRQHGLVIHTPETLKQNYAKRFIDIDYKKLRNRGRKKKGPDEPYEPRSERTNFIIRLLEKNHRPQEIAVRCQCSTSLIYHIRKLISAKPYRDANGKIKQPLTSGPD